MIKVKIWTIILVLSLCTIHAIGEIRLPSVLSSNMVLQQRSTVQLWGWCGPSEKIYITPSWSNKTDSVIGTRDANWKFELATPAAGGPYTITFKGSNTIKLENILLGEVWVCSGQSNMEWSSYQNLKQIIDELPTSSNDNIRLLNVPKATSIYPQDDIPASWKVCGPETLKGFSAIAYFFGKKLQKELNVPIGLINSSWGGTPAEVWTPSGVLDSDEELKKAAAALSPAPWWPHEAGKTYNAMIAPLTHFSIAGALWYQGESNVLTASSYNSLFGKMIGAWRKEWNKEFPFYFVQIAPFVYGNKNVGALLREQQTLTGTTPRTGMVVITDLVENVKDIHPGDKKNVADRLANWALADTYQKPVAAYKSPSYKNLQIRNGKAELYFDDAPNGFMLKGTKAAEWFIAGADQKFVPADVKLEKDRIVVSSKLVATPVAVRFGFSNSAMGNIFSKEGLPVNPFRTDTWEVDTSKETP